MLAKTSGRNVILKTASRHCVGDNGLADALAGKRFAEGFRVGNQASAFRFFAALLRVLDVLQGQLGRIDLALFRCHHGLFRRHGLAWLLGLLGFGRGELVKSHAVFIAPSTRLNEMAKLGINKTSAVFHRSFGEYI